MIGPCSPFILKMSAPATARTGLARIGLQWRPCSEWSGSGKSSLSHRLQSPIELVAPARAGSAAWRFMPGSDHGSLFLSRGKWLDGDAQRVCPGLLLLGIGPARLDLLRLEFGDLQRTRPDRAAAPEM